jgi:hypothetical protein
VRFRHGEQDGVVLSLRSTLDYDYASFSVIGRFRENLEEQRLGNVVGAGASYEVAAGHEKLHGSQVDFFVPALGCWDAVAILGKGGWVEDDHAEAAARFVIFLQQVERVAFAKVNI